jgi:hypothetical protein
MENSIEILPGSSERIYGGSSQDFVEVFRDSEEK